MKKILSALLIIIAFASCTPNREDDAPQTKSKTIQVNTQFRIKVNNKSGQPEYSEIRMTRETIPAPR